MAFFTVVVAAEAEDVEARITCLVVAIFIMYANYWQQEYLYHHPAIHPPMGRRRSRQLGRYI